MLTPNIAHQNYELTIELKRDVVFGIWKLVKVLKECRENKYWEILGHQSFASYLAQPELDLNEHTVNNWITTLNRFEELHLLPPEGVDVSKLSIIAPHLTSENASDLIEKAKTLSRSDLRAEVLQAEITPVKLCTCPTCGNVHKTS